MKALVLSSGGVDSTTCIGIEVDKYGKEKQCGKCGTCIDKKKHLN